MDICSGEGWRLRVDPDRQPFVALIGGADWAAELSAAELLALQLAVSTLLEQLQATAPLLMPEETLELDFEQPGLWLQLSGTVETWSLRFVLTPEQGGPAAVGRGLEGGWSAAASQAFAAALLAHVLPAAITVPA